MNPMNQKEPVHAPALLYPVPCSLFTFFVPLRPNSMAMKKYFWIFAVLLLLGTSCSRKIVGARPHRKERNCGCEYPTTPAPADSLLTYHCR